MLPYLSIGPYIMPAASLTLLVGLWVGITFAEKEGRRLLFAKDQIYNLTFVGLLAGIVGARLVYVAQYITIYFEDPLSIVALNPGTLSPPGGFLIGLVTATLYAFWKKLPLQKTLDALAPGLAVFMIFWGLAHLLSGNAFGSATNLPWAIYLWDENRHPTQVYEILLATGIFLIIYKHPLGQSGDGTNFLLLVALTAASHLFLEAFRGDSLIWTGGLRAGQVISLAILLLSLWLIRQWSLPTLQKENR